MPRRTKAQLHEDLRNEVTEKLLNILRITDDNRFIMIDSLKEERVEAIELLVPDIKKAFAHNDWSYFKRSGDITSLLKSIFREMGFTCNMAYIMDDKNKKIKMKAIFLPLRNA